MAFSFGTSTPASTPSFSFGGQASTPAFGAPAASTPAAASTPSFGFGAAQSTPGFGTAVSTPAYGAPASAPSLFGAQPAAATSTPSLFGATSTPSLFGAASTPSLFGAASAPASGAQSTPSLFGATPAAGASTPSFGFGTGAIVAASSTPSLFGAPQQQAAVGQQAAVLVTKDGRPLTHTTKWDDLSPQAQQYLLELEKKVVEFREECRQLDGEERLSKGKDAKPGGIEKDARLLSQRITSLGTVLRADSDTCEALLELVRRLLRNTETALYTFKRSYLWREGLKSTQGQALPSHVMDQLAGPVVLPSHYLREAVAGFQENLAQYKACVAELDQVLAQQAAAQQQLGAGRLLVGSGAGAGGPPADMLQSLQSALTNLHDLLIHSAAKLQALDDRLAAAKEAHLATRRQGGDYSDPFGEAERQQRSNGGGATNGFGSDRQPAAPGAAAPAAAGAPTQQPLQGQPAAGPAPLASPFGASSPALATAPSGLFGTLTPAASAPFGGGFGTPLFGPATSATVRKGKGKK